MPVLTVAGFAVTAGVVAVGVGVELGRDRSTRRLAVLAIPALAAVAIATIWIGERAVIAEHRHIADLVEGMAPTYAAEMQRLGHDTITCDTAEDDPTYLILIEAQKQWLALNPAITDIYTFGRRDGNTVLLVDSETDYDRDGVITGTREARTAIGEPYTSAPEAIGAAFGGEHVFDPTPTTDRWGTWVSAYVPIRRGGATTGPGYAVLGIDFPAAEWVRAGDARRTEMLTIGALVLVILAGAALANGAAWRVAASRERTANQLAHALDSLRITQAHLVENEKLAALGRLLAGLSHEINNPVNVITNTLDAVRDDTRALARLLDPAYAEEGTTLVHGLNLAVTDLADATDRISAIHGDLRAFIRTGEAAREAVDILARVRAAVSLLAHTAPAGVRFEVARESPPPVMGDVGQIDQIIVSLVRNAIDAVGEHGVIRVEASATADVLSVHVIDSGPGVPDDVARRLFEPFFSTKGPGRGTGLGLAISRELAQRNGGTLRLERASSPGAHFVLELPLTRA